VKALRAAVPSWKRGRTFMPGLGEHAGEQFQGSPKLNIVDPNTRQQIDYSAGSGVPYTAQQIQHQLKRSGMLGTPLPEALRSIEDPGDALFRERLGRGLPKRTLDDAYIGHPDDPAAYPESTLTGSQQALGYAGLYGGGSLAKGALGRGATNVGLRGAAGAAGGWLGLGLPYMAQEGFALVPGGSDDYSSFNPASLAKRTQHGNVTKHEWEGLSEEGRDELRRGRLDVLGLKNIRDATHGFPSGSMASREDLDAYPAMTSWIAGQDKPMDINPRSIHQSMQGQADKWNRENVLPDQAARRMHAFKMDNLMGRLTAAGSGVSKSQFEKMIGSKDAEGLAQHGIGLDPVSGDSAVGGINEERLWGAQGKDQGINPGHVKAEHTNAYNGWLGSEMGQKLLADYGGPGKDGTYSITRQQSNKLGKSFNDSMLATQAVNSDVASWNGTAEDHAQRAIESNADVYISTSDKGQPMIQVSKWLFGKSTPYQTVDKFGGMEGALKAVNNERLNEHRSLKEQGFLQGPGESHKGWSAEFADKRFKDNNDGYVLRDHKQDPLLATAEQRFGQTGLFGVLGDGGRIAGKDGTQYDMDRVPQEIENYWRTALNEPGGQNTKRFRRLALLEAYRGNRITPAGEVIPAGGEPGFSGVSTLLQSNRTAIANALGAPEQQSEVPPYPQNALAAIFRGPRTNKEMQDRGLSVDQNDIMYGATASDSGGNIKWTTLIEPGPRRAPQAPPQPEGAITTR